MSKVFFSRDVDPNESFFPNHYFCVQKIAEALLLSKKIKLIFYFAFFVRSRTASTQLSISILIQHKRVQNTSEKLITPPPLPMRIFPVEYYTRYQRCMT